MTGVPWDTSLLTVPRNDRAVATAVLAEVVAALTLVGNLAVAASPAVRSTPHRRVDLCICSGR